MLMEVDVGGNNSHVQMEQTSSSSTTLKSSNSIISIYLIKL